MKHHHDHHSHDHHSHPHRYAESRRITLWGAAKNAFLAIVKLFFGTIGHSHALVADGIHSLSDLLIDGLVLIASRFGSHRADHEHPYGHRRIETAMTVLLSLILTVTALGIIWDAGLEVFGGRKPTIPSFFVLVVALISVLVNEVLYRYTLTIGERIQSRLIIANAWHHRSDSLSSWVVVIGVGAAWLGLSILDAVAAAVVALMILKVAWEFGFSSVRELVDRGVDDAQVEAIRAVIVGVSGVRALHQLRTRSMGGQIYLDVHILVDPCISVSEGHFIGQQVHFQLYQMISNVVDVTVHVDPEDDEVLAPARHLSNRVVLVEQLKHCWQAWVAPDVIEQAILHYLGGTLRVELRLPWDMQLAQDAEGLLQTLRHAARSLELGEVSIALIVNG